MAPGALLDAVRALAWPARRRVAGARSGTHPSRLRGRAPELSEYRLYRQGDDPRDLDWKLLARSDRPFVRLSDDRAIHATWFVVDATASMAFPEGSHDKWRCAGELAVALGSIAQRAGDPVALLVAGASAWVPPTTRRDVVSAMDRVLGEVTPAGSDPLVPAMARVAAGTRLVLLTDLLGDEGPARAAGAAHLAQGGEVVVVHVVSRAELALDPALTLARDPEAPAVQAPVDAEGAAAYRAAFQAWLDATRAAWIAMGATYVRVVAEEDRAAAVRQVVAGLEPARER